MTSKNRRAVKRAARMRKSLQEIYLLACRFDVMALKPGNVSIALPGHDMVAQQFLAAARASATSTGRGSNARRVYFGGDSVPRSELPDAIPT